MTCKKGHFHWSLFALSLWRFDLSYFLYFTWTFSGFPSTFSFLEKEPFPDTPIDLSYFSLAFFFFLSSCLFVWIPSFYPSKLGRRGSLFLEDEESRRKDEKKQRGREKTLLRKQRKKGNGTRGRKICSRKCKIWWLLLVGRKGKVTRWG